MEIVILVGTGVIAVFFWVLLLLIFCNMRRVSVPPPTEPLHHSLWDLSTPCTACKIRNKVLIRPSSPEASPPGKPLRPLHARLLHHQRLSVPSLLESPKGDPICPG